MSPKSDSHGPGQMAESGGNLKIIDLEFETLRQFREVMAPRLNYDGFFVVTNDPLPRGTPARFRFMLKDGFVLAEGTALVAWVRYTDEERDLRAGMALMFNELQSASREIIDELIDFNIATGGDPFDMGPKSSEAGDIGTDALAGKLPEVQPPLETTAPPTPESETEPSDSADTTTEDYIPEWLSEVAQKHDVDLSADDTVPTGTTLEAVQAPEAPQAEQQDFEISLMPEDEDQDQTPFQEDASSAPEVLITPTETRMAPKRLWLRPLLAVAAVLVVASAIVWWIANRAPDTAPRETVATVEEIPAPETTIGVAEEKPEPTIEVVEEKPEELVGKPPGVSEKIPESPQIEEPTGPATRILLVAAARIGDETVVRVRTNGELSEKSVRVSLLKDPARVWVRIRGIETVYRPNDIEVGTPEVERLRVGHHPEETPQSIYVVMDLENPAAVVRDYTVERDTLRVVVARP